MSDSSNLQIDPNSADEEQLRQLPGIGPELAARIVASRPYDDVEQLAQIPGVGGAVIEEIRPYLVFESGEEMTGSQMVETQDEGDIPGREALEPDQSSPNSASEFVAEADDQEDEKDHAASDESKPVKAEKRGSPGALAILAVAFATVLCSVTMTLAVMAGINGTLDFGSHSSIQAVSSDIRQLQSDLDAAIVEVDSLQARTQALQGVSGRMTEVEGELEGLQQQLDGALTTVESMQADLAVALNETQAQAERVNRFQAFLEGLAQVLSEATGQE